MESPSARYLLLGCDDGWICFSSICTCGFCRRFCQRLFGVRDGARRVRCMPAHHYAVANRNTDRGLRSAHAGLRHPEIASGAELAKYLATLTWHNPDRSDPVDLHQPGLSAIRRWAVAGALHDLRSEEHTSELQSRQYLVCRLLLVKKTRHNYIRGDQAAERDIHHSGLRQPALG